MDAIDPQQLSLPKSTIAIPSRPKKVPRHKMGDRFLCGPIPLAWIVKATPLPGKSWHVATAIWYLAGLTKSPTVKLTQGVLNQFGIDRFAKYRALAALESAKLIQVSSSNGKNPLVTLLDVGGVEP
jgi:hypothetical protein